MLLVVGGVLDDRRTRKAGTGVSLRLAWSPRAEREIREIRSWQDAAWICAEVVRYAECGIGDVRRAPTKAGPSAPVLFLAGRFRVVFVFDRLTQTLWVRSVFRAPA